MARQAEPRKEGSTASTTLRAQHVEATRRAVLNAARAAFGEKGYAQTSVDEIATAARVTKGAIYHHFASKETLFRAVHAEVEAEAQARTALAGENSRGAPIDRIIAGVNAYLDAALDKEIRRITLIDGPALLGLEPEGSADEEAGYVGVRMFIAAAIGRGQIIDLDPDLVTHLIRGLALQGGLLIARASDPDRARAMLGRAFDAMLRGLAPRRVRPDPGR